MGEFESQAADKTIKIVLDGAEYVLRLSAKAMSKGGAFLLALGKLAKEEQHSKGAQTLKTMIKSGKELTVFSISPANLKEFSKEAKHYGVVYCAVKSKSDPAAPIDMLVRAEDAGRINRIIERCGFNELASGEAEMPGASQNPTKGRQREPARNPERQSSNSWTDDKDARASVVQQAKQISAEKQAHTPHRVRHLPQERGL